jgi:hypothetical protein
MEISNKSKRGIRVSVERGRERGTRAMLMKRMPKRKLLPPLNVEKKDGRSK